MLSTANYEGKRKKKIKINKEINKEININL